MFCATYKGKQGLMSLSGNWVIPPEYDALKLPTCGMVPVQLDRRWGWVDLLNRWIVRPCFEEVDNFVDGRIVTQHNQLYGLHDIGGRAVINSSWPLLWAPINGLVYGRRPGPIHVLMDVFGKAVLCSNAFSLNYFGDPGYIIEVRYPVDYIEEAGVGEFQDIDDEEFHETDPDVRYVRIDGTPAIKEVFREAWPFCEGLAAVTREDGTRGYIDHLGTLVVRPSRQNELGMCPAFSESKALLQYRNDLVQCINQRGDILWDGRFRTVLNFSEGVAAAQGIDGKWGWIDSGGKHLLEPRFDYCGSFKMGIAEAVTGGERRFIRPSGVEVWVEPCKPIDWI